MTKTVFQPDQIVEDYRIKKLIGKGGMAELYLADEKALERDVVIKVLSPVLSKNKDFIEQFLREARIQANLDNPHIVQIFRIFNYHDNLCLVMNHVEGTDLSKIIKKAREIKEKKNLNGALSLERAVNIFLQILEGIGFAHKYRIIHGDIKPANILIDEQGRARVADFGLSFLLVEDDKEKKEIVAGGTPYFMSPEQIIDEIVDFRSDVYSLGVTFFNILSGTVPTGENIQISEILEYHLEGSLDRPKKILDGVEEIHGGIKAAILTALQNDPSKRHQSCLEFSLAIKEKNLYEMYSEILRWSLSTKNNFTLKERVYLDRIAEKRGLDSEQAKALEINVRKEMKLPPLDFSKEYNSAFEGRIFKGEEDEQFLKELEDTYVTRARISKAKALSMITEAKEKKHKQMPALLKPNIYQK